MTDPSLAATTGLPPVNRAMEPSWVRNGSEAVQRNYQTALAFEKTLVEQLTQTLVRAGGLGEGSEEDAGGSGPAQPGAAFSGLLPQALATAISSDGGLGLAAQLTREQQRLDGSTATGATGGSQS